MCGNTEDGDEVTLMYAKHEVSRQFSISFLFCVSFCVRTATAFSSLEYREQYKQYRQHRLKDTGKKKKFSMEVSWIEVSHQLQGRRPKKSSFRASSRIACLEQFLQKFYRLSSSRLSSRDSLVQSFTTHMNRKEKSVRTFLLLFETRSPSMKQEELDRNDDETCWSELFVLLLLCQLSILFSVHL